MNLMKIEIDPHTLERAEQRGANEEEIIDVINTGSEIAAKHGRIGKGRIYSFKDKRNSEYY